MSTGVDISLFAFGGLHSKKSTLLLLFAFGGVKKDKSFSELGNFF